MAVSAFKSSSRRSTQNPGSAGSSARDPDKKPPPPRRSRSVSAYARRGHQPEVVSPEFLIKRDNPLFCSGDGSVRDGGFGDGPPLKERVLGLGDDVRMINGGFRGDGVWSGGRQGKGEALDAGDGRRGRSVSRDGVIGSVLVGSRKGVGRSLSRVDAGRRSRSVSQNPVPRGYSVTSESEIDQDSHSVADSNKGMPKSKMGARAANSLEISNATENLRTWTSQHPVTELQYDSATSLACSRDDNTSTDSLSGLEEKTVRAISEQMKVVDDDFVADMTNGSVYETVHSEVRRAITDIQNDLAICRSSGATIVGSNLADISPNLVHPGTVELAMDIRSEYAKKLEESQERARKLRADLAVEEYHVQELGRILKEILPEPRTSMQKTRLARKASIERRRMSKRLTEEAMAYFDECVSLSTFDSSDFSSTEDPLLQLAGDTNPEPFTDGRLRHHNEYSRATDCTADKHETNPCCSQSHNSDPSPGNTLSLSGKYSDLQQDIKRLLKRSTDNSTKGDEGTLGSSQRGLYLVEEYSYLATSESSLSERVVNKKWLESGSLLLCDEETFSPFRSFI